MTKDALEALKPATLKAPAAKDTTPSTSFTATSGPTQTTSSTNAMNPEQEERLLELWHFAYRSAIDSIFGKGLAYWNGKTKQLEQELELAVQRADQTLAAYIRVRNRTADPTFIAVQQWYREHNKDNPLAQG